MICSFLAIFSLPEFDLNDLHIDLAVAESDHQFVKQSDILINIPIAAHIALRRHRREAAAPGLQLFLILQREERVYPGENGRLLPGCGAMTAPVEWCANRQCDLVIGKPNTMMVDYIKSAYHIDESNILVVGDTYESDIEMAKRAGCYSVLISSQYYDDTICIDSIKDLPSVFIS